MPHFEDCTPTWESMTPYMINTLRRSDDAQSIEDISGEITRMAQLADKYNAAVKAGLIK